MEFVRWLRCYQHCYQKFRACEFIDVIRDVEVEMSAKYVWAMKALWKISPVVGDETSTFHQWNEELQSTLEEIKVCRETCFIARLLVYYLHVWVVAVYES